MHCGVVVAVAGATVAAVVGGGFVVLGADAFGGDACCEAQAATPTELSRRMATTRITFDIGALSD
jgi:hypothetical protein